MISIIFYLSLLRSADILFSKYHLFHALKGVSNCSLVATLLTMKDPQQILFDQFHLVYRPNRADCPGADFYTPQGRTDDPARSNTKAMFDPEMKTTGFQSDSPTWMGDSPSTKSTGGKTIC